jgi:hypothetical protein
MNYEQKYIKYKQKYLALKNSNYELEGGGSTFDPSNLYNESKEDCFIIKFPLKKGQNIEQFNFLPKKIVELFNEISLDRTMFKNKKNPQLMELSKGPDNGTWVNYVQLFKTNTSFWQQYVFAIVTIIFILILITKKIYVFNEAVIHYVRDPLDISKSRFLKNYENFKILNYPRFLYEMDNILKIIQKEHRLLTVGMTALNKKVVDRLPSIINTPDLYSTLGNLIEIFEISFEDIFKYIFHENLTPYISDKEDYKEIFDILQHVITENKKYWETKIDSLYAIQDLTSDKVDWLNRLCKLKKHWVFTNEKILNDKIQILNDKIQKKTEA